MFNNSTSNSTGSESLRRLEAVSLAATAVAFAITLILVKSGYAVESNVVARSLIATFGWTGAGVLALSVEAGVFRLYRHYHSRAPRVTLAAGLVLAVLVGVGDVLLNLGVLATTGWPETIAWSAVGPSLFAISLAATAAYTPRRTIRLCRDLGSSVRRMPVPGDRIQQAATVVVTGMVVLSMVSGMVAFTSIPVEAGGSPTVLEDMEDDTSQFTQTDDWAITNTDAAVGGKSLFVEDTANNIQSAVLDHDNVSPDSYSFYYRVGKINDSDPGKGQTYIRDDNGNTAFSINFAGENQNITYWNGGSINHKLGNYTVGTWYKVRIDNINFSTKTADIEIRNKDGTPLYSAVDVSFKDSLNEFGTLESKEQGNGGAYWLDHVATNTYTTQNVEGQVVDQQGNGIDQATVQLYGVNYSSPSIASAENKGQKARQTLNDLTEASPTGWDPDLDPEGDIFSSTDGEYAMVTTSTVDSDSWFTSSDLGDPQVKVPANTQLYFSAWDADGGGFVANNLDEWDSELPGQHKQSGRIVIEQLGPSGDTKDTTYASIDQKKASGGLDPSKFHYATTKLSPGYYKIYPKGNEATAYIIQVGELDEIARLFMPNATNAKGNPLKAAQDEADALKENRIWKTTVKTNSNGRFTVRVPNYVKTVGIQVVGTRSPDIPDPRKTTDLQSAINRSENVSFNGSIVYSPAPKVVDAPASNVTVRAVHVDLAPYVDPGVQMNRSEWREDILSNLSFSDLPPSIQQALEKLNRTDLEGTYEQLENLTEQNQRLRDRYREILKELENDDDDLESFKEWFYSEYPNQDPGDVSTQPVNNTIKIGLDPGNATDEELRTRIQALQQSLNELQSTIEAGDPSSSTSGGTLDYQQPFSTDLEAEDVLVRIQYTNGSTLSLTPGGSEYVSIEQNALGNDAVTISGVPLGDNAGAAVDITVANQDGIGEISDPVSNPEYSGEKPEFDAVEWSTLRPGQNQTVTGRLHPSEDGPRVNITSVTVTGPDGGDIATTDSGRSFNFTTTSGAGIYVAEIGFKTPNGQTHTLVQRLEAGASSRALPPTVRLSETPYGTLAVVGNGLTGGDVDLQSGGTRVEVTAQIPADQQSVSELHVHTTGASLPPSTTVAVAVVSGPQQQSTNKHVPVTVHMAGLPDSALLYRNGDPLPENSPRADITSESGSTVVATHTDDSGYLTLASNSNPGVIERLQYEVTTRIPDIDVPFTFIDPGLAASAGLLPVVGLAGAVAARRRRRKK